uniref:Uncharacterized protein n=1 Tax=Podarcis muralis TaxID=64176 RepID=A0A670HZ34_PODMU
MLQRENLRGEQVALATYILACNRRSWGDPEINSALQRGREFRAALHLMYPDSWGLAGFIYSEMFHHLETWFPVL